MRTTDDAYWLDIESRVAGRGYNITTVYRDERFLVTISGDIIRTWTVSDAKQRRTWSTDIYTGENTTWWMLLRLRLLLRKVRPGNHFIDRAARLCARHFLMESPELTAARKEVDDIAPETP